ARQIDDAQPGMSQPDPGILKLPLTVGTAMAKERQCTLPSLGPAGFPLFRRGYRTDYAAHQSASCAPGARWIQTRARPRLDSIGRSQYIALNNSRPCLHRDKRCAVTRVAPA